MIEQDINERMADLAPSQNIGTESVVASLMRDRGMTPTVEQTVEEPQFPQAGPPVQDPVDAVVDRIIERRRERLTSTMYGASKVNPDKAALAQKLARETGIGSGIALRHIDELMVDSRMREIERKNYFESNPVLAEQLSDPEFAAVAQDDIGTLEKIGGFFQEWSMFQRTGYSPSIAKGAARGMLMVERGRIGTAAELGLANPQDIDRAEQMREDMGKLQGGGLFAATAEVVTQQIMSLRETGTAAAGGAAIGSVIPGVGTAAGGALGFAAGTIMTTAQMEGGNAYLDMRRDGVSDDVAIPASIAIGYLNGAIEVAGLKLAASPFKALAKKAFKDATAEALAKPTVRAALAVAGKEYAKQVGGEATEESLQQFVSIIGERIAKAAEGIEYDGTLKSDFGQIIDSFAGGALASVLLGSIGPGSNLIYDLNRAEAAANTQRVLENLSTAAKEGTLRPRSPVMFERYLQAQAERYDADTIYIAAPILRDVINQSGMTPEQLEQVLPGTAERIREALFTGGDVKIPTAQFAATVAGSKFGDALIPHMRLDPDAKSASEASAILQNRESIRQEATQIIQQMEQTNESFVQSAGKVEDTIRSQVEAAGRPREEADIAAVLLRDFYVTIAAKRGITPEEAYAADAVSIAGEAGVAPVVEALEQPEQFLPSGERRTDTPEFKAWSRNAPIFEADEPGFTTGTPMVVKAYHGTNKTFVEFKMGRPAWFAARPGTAGQYVAGGRRKMGDKPGRGSQIIPVYLSFQRPLDLRYNIAGETTVSPQSRVSMADVLEAAGLPNDEQALRTIAERNLASGFAGVAADIEDKAGVLAAQYANKNKLWSILDDQGLIETLKEAGFDGLILSEGGNIFAALNDKDIKSVNNRGTWSRTSPNIMEQAAQKHPFRSLLRAWDKYNDQVEVYQTPQDLADRVETLLLDGRAPAELEDALRKFREEQAYDVEVKGRGEMDTAGEELEIAVQNAAEAIRAEIEQAQPKQLEQAETVTPQGVATPQYRRAWHRAQTGVPITVTAWHAPGGSEAAQLTDFARERMNRETTLGAGWYGARDRDIAETYGKPDQFEVTLQNPFVFSEPSKSFVLKITNEELQRIRDAGHDGIIVKGVNATLQGQDRSHLEVIAFDPGRSVRQIAPAVTQLEQAAVPAEAGADAPGIGVANENRLGFWPALRVRIQPDAALPEKPLILTGTTNKNATKQLANLDDILGRFPNAAESPEAWAQMLAYAFGTDDVPVPPYAFINDTNGNGSFARLSTLTQGQIADATHGFDNAREFRRAYINNELNVVTTGKLFLWSFLSRGVSPYTQESLFIDAFDGANEWIKKAAAGKFTEADFDDYTAWAKSVAKKGSGQPGAGATHNLNAFGKNFLFKMGAIGEDGKSNLQRLHDMMSDPEQTGRMIRREFAKFGEGVGIDNKVVSFTLLVAGFNDVMVLDRVQVRQLWDDGRFSGTNLYDGVMDAEGQKIAGSSLNALTEGVRGILVYEAIERQLAAKINDLYAKLGRPQDASIGRYHWETWVAYSQQEAAHATLDAILLDAKGDDQAIAKVSGKQGEYGSYEYGAQYNRDTDRTPWFRYTTPLGGTYDFSVPAFRQFLTEIKKVGNGVVPAKFKVTESGNAPWYTRPEVNQQRLEEQAAKWSDRGGGTGEGTRLVREAAANADAIRARSGAGVQPAGRGKVLEQAARGPARGTFDPRTLITTINRGGDLSTLIHESAHAFLTIYARIAERPDAPAQIKADVDALLKWFGIAGATPEARLAAWNGMTLERQKKYHERFAYNFEIYAWEGKAPSAELRGLFNRFRTYLTRIYKSIRDDLNAIYRREFGEDLPILTNEVRQVMDRMLASEEQIRRYQAVQSMAPIFQTQEESGMDDATWAAYVAMNQEAEDQAIADLTKASLAQVGWMKRAREAAERAEERGMAARRKDVRKEAEDEVRLQLVYRVQQYLRTGKFRDDAGEEVTVDGPHRLSIERIEAVYAGIPTEESIAAIRATGMAVPSVVQPDWRKLGTGKSGMLAKEGLDPEMVAQTFGYDGADAMIRALVDAKPINEAIEQRTDELMQERYGEMDSPDAREQRISMAIHNEARARFIAVELRHIAKATQPVRVMLEAARIAAEDIISGKRIRDIRPQDHEASEARAARDAAGARRAAGNPAAAAQAAYTRAKNAVLEAPREDTPEALLAATEAAEVAGEAARAASMQQSAERINRFVQEYGNVEPDLLVIRAKRAQLYQNQLAAEARKAKEYVEKQVKYLRRVLRTENRKRMGAEYAEQIEALLANVNLIALTAEQRQRLADLAAWLKTMEENGNKPDISEDLAKAAFRVPYKDLTLEQFRELVEAVRTIEYMGKNQQKLLMEKQEADFKEKEEAINKRIEAVARSRGRDAKIRRSAQTRAGKAVEKIKGFFASGFKAWAIVEILDGGPDGPLYNFLIRTATERANMETDMTAKATERLAAILKPWYDAGNMMAGKVMFPSIGRAMTREARLAIALNVGNAGNIQRLLDGEGWTMDQVQPILESLTSDEWDAVQQVWDFMDEYRPLIAEKERRLFGKEPNWVEPQELTVRTADGQVKTLRGGYYPIVYDPVATFRAEKQSEVDEAQAQLKGAYSSATTRRTFTKERAAKVEDSPLLYSLQGLWSGVTDVIHDLSWHEWLIDANRLMRSKEFDSLVRSRYGENPKLELRRWIEDNASGNRGVLTPGARASSFFRQNVSVAGLGYSIRGALMQLTGFSLSITRVGYGPLLRAIGALATNPVQTMRRVNSMSKFMEMRSRTQFRELNEIRNRVEGERGWQRGIRSHAYTMMLSMQRLVDVPTWIAGYENAIAAGKDEDAAVALADQAVIATQGSGLLKDLSRIEREPGLAKLFSVFYSYFNTVFNLAAVQTMNARSKGKAAHDLLLILVVPVMLEQLLKEILTPDGDDAEEKDLQKIAAKLTRAEVEYLLGMFMYAREMSGLAGLIEGEMRGYEGPAGLRVITTMERAAQQAAQGEFDRAFRRASVDLLGAGLGLPSAQINRTIDGLEALSEGETENPLSAVMGIQRR